METLTERNAALEGQLAARDQELGDLEARVASGSSTDAAMLEDKK